MLTGAENNLLNIARIFVLFGIILYALFIAFFFRYLDDPQTIDLISYALLASFASFLIINQNFPSLKMPSEIVKPFYPVKRWNRILINLTYDLFRPTILYVFFFLLFFSLITAKPDWWFFRDGILIVVGLVCLDFSFKLFISKRNKHPLIVLCLLGISIGVLVGYFIAAFFSYLNTYWEGSLVVIIWFLGNILLYIFTMVQTEEPAVEEVERETEFISNIAKVPRLIYNRNTNTWPTFIFIFAFNALIAVYIYFFRHTMPTALIDVYSYLLIFPIIPFTFVHNNLFGFMRSIWLELQLRSSSNRIKLKIYLGCLWPPLLLDTTVSFSALYLLEIYHWQYILLFFLSLFIMVPAGYWTTNRFPRTIKSFQVSGFQNNTSSRMSFVTVAVLTIVGVLFFYVGMVYAIILTTCFSILMIYLITKKKKKQKYLMYQKLYKN